MKFNDWLISKHPEILEDSRWISNSKLSDYNLSKKQIKDKKMGRAKRIDFQKRKETIKNRDEE